MALQDDLRQAIEDSGLTLYRIAKGSGIAYQVLHRFANGERDLTLASAPGELAPLKVWVSTSEKTVDELLNPTVDTLAMSLPTTSSMTW